MNFEEAKSNDDPRQAAQHRKNLAKLIEGFGYRHNRYDVFRDFCEMAALSISNAVDRPQYEAREKRYMEIVKRYTPEEVAQFPTMLAELTLALDAAPHDALGMVFHDLELHNKDVGQFFTPYDVCRMMAKMTLADDIRAKIEERGFVKTQEPACGAGAMVIALAHEMRDMGINYQQHLHVTAVDIDPKCAAMAYLQFSLLHIPAIVVHGNTLSLEEFGRWHTPAHVMGGWQWKIRPSRKNALLTPEPVAHVDDIPVVETLEAADLPAAATAPAKPVEEPTRPMTHAEKVKARRRNQQQLSFDLF